VPVNRGEPTFRRASFGGLGGLRGAPPLDLVILVGTLFVTWSLQFFDATGPLVALLRLSPLVFRGWLWQLATYPFIGYGRATLWVPLELVILYMFGRDVLHGLGRKRFWQLVMTAAVAAGVLALLVEVGREEGVAALPLVGPFPLLQGQQVLLAITIAAFATANRSASILLFFVLPIEARYFLWIEIVIAFVGYLQSHDLGGFLGICAAVALSYLYVREGGSFGRGLRQTRLRIERWWLQGKLDRAKRRRGLRVVKGDGGRDPWVQ
jgi:membrane associated rhomboid family serine protease